MPSPPLARRTLSGRAHWPAFQPVQPILRVRHLHVGPALSAYSPLINPTESGGRSRHYRGLGCGDRAQRLTPISPGGLRRPRPSPSSLRIWHNRTAVIPAACGVAD
jgi:hypothetical protein